MLNEPVWIDPDGVVLLNERLVAATGEPHLLVSRELLESACDKARNHWNYGERDIANLATELLFGIARNHPFSQGNKRTAFTAMVGFLGCNGYAFHLVDDVNCAEHIIRVLEGNATQESFADGLREIIVPAKPWG